MPLTKRKATGDMAWDDYQSVDTIYEWLDSLQADYPDFVNVTTIGTSYEGRPLRLLKLSKKAVIKSHTLILSQVRFINCCIIKRVIALFSSSHTFMHASGLHPPHQHTS